MMTKGFSWVSSWVDLSAHPSEGASCTQDKPSEYSLSEPNSIHTWGSRSSSRGHSVALITPYELLPTSVCTSLSRISRGVQGSYIALARQVSRTDRSSTASRISPHDSDPFWFPREPICHSIWGNRPTSHPSGPHKALLPNSTEVSFSIPSRRGSRHSPVPSCREQSSLVSVPSPYPRFCTPSSHPHHSNSSSSIYRLAGGS